MEKVIRITSLGNIQENRFLRRHDTKALDMTFHKRISVNTRVNCETVRFGVDTVVDTADNNLAVDIKCKKVLKDKNKILRTQNPSPDHEEICSSHDLDTMLYNKQNVVCAS